MFHVLCLSLTLRTKCCFMNKTFYSEIREFDLKLPGNYQGISFHELAGNHANGHSGALISGSIRWSHACNCSFEVKGVCCKVLCVRVQWPVECWFWWLLTSLILLYFYFIILLLSVFLTKVFIIYHNNQEFCLSCHDQLSCHVFCFFYLRYNHLLSLVMFNTSSTKFWGWIGNFNGS